MAYGLLAVIFIWPSSRRTGFFGNSGPVILCRPESMMKDIQIRQSAGCEQAIGIFLQAAIPHLGEPEFQFDHADYMLDAPAHLGRRPVPGSLGLVHKDALTVTSVGPIARLWRLLLDELALALIRLVTPDIALLALRIARYGVDCVFVVVVVEVGGGGGDGVVVVSIVVVLEGGAPPHPANRVIVPIIAAPASSRILDVWCFIFVS